MLSFFFFNDTATTEIYTLSLHDALPICIERKGHCAGGERASKIPGGLQERLDRKSTRLNSSHLVISYAVFCLKKKKIKTSTSNSVALDEIIWYEAREKRVTLEFARAGSA